MKNAGTIIEEIIEGHMEDINAALDAFAGEENITLADYVGALEDLHYQIGAMVNAGRADLARLEG